MEWARADAVQSGAIRIGPIRRLLSAVTGLRAFKSLADALLCRRRGAFAAPSRGRNLTQNVFQGKKRLGALAFAHQVRSGPVHHDLGRARPAVAIGTHAHGLGAGRHQRQQVAFARGEPLLNWNMAPSFACYSWTALARCRAAAA